MANIKQRDRVPTVTFITSDGILVLNRETEWTYVDDADYYSYSMKADARIKGVRIVRWEKDLHGITAIVEWL